MSSVTKTSVVAFSRTCETTITRSDTSQINKIGDFDGAYIYLMSQNKMQFTRMARNLPQGSQISEMNIASLNCNEGLLIMCKRLIWTV